MSMKLNERSMAHYATCDSPADRTGYLYKKGERHTAYQKRWFILKGNLLFYFEERESKEPMGVVVLEGCTVELCQSNEEYAFAVRFDKAGSRPYILAAESQEEMECWVKALSRASFEYMRLVVRELERQLELMQKSVNRKRNSRHTVKSHTVGRVKWEDARAADFCNGFRHPEDSNIETEGRRGSCPMPPPLPPRRRGVRWDDAVLPAPSVTTLESPVCPGTVCFSKLHEWYGKEIEDLQKEWQEERRRQND
ncbi:sesquipedalian-2 isoform X2 [Ascaphus truei]